MPILNWIFNDGFTWEDLADIRVARSGHALPWGTRASFRD